MNPFLSSGVLTADVQHMYSRQHWGKIQWERWCTYWSFPIKNLLVLIMSAVFRQAHGSLFSMEVVDKCSEWSCSLEQDGGNGQVGTGVWTQQGWKQVLALEGAQQDRRAVTPIWRWWGWPVSEFDWRQWEWQWVAGLVWMRCSALSMIAVFPRTEQ